MTSRGSVDHRETTLHPEAVVAASKVWVHKCARAPRTIGAMAGAQAPYPHGQDHKPCYMNSVGSLPNPPLVFSGLFSLFPCISAQVVPKHLVVLSCCPQ